MAKTKDKSIFVSSVDSDSDIEEIIMPPKPPVEVIQLDDSDDECQDICKPIYNKKVHKDPIVRVSYRQRIPESYFPGISTSLINVQREHNNRSKYDTWGSNSCSEPRISISNIERLEKPSYHEARRVPVFERLERSREISNGRNNQNPIRFNHKFVPPINRQTPLFNNQQLLVNVPFNEHHPTFLEPRPFYRSNVNEYNAGGLNRGSFRKMGRLNMEIVRDNDDFEEHFLAPNFPAKSASIDRRVDDSLSSNSYLRSGMIMASSERLEDPRFSGRLPVFARQINNQEINNDNFYQNSICYNHNNYPSNLESRVSFPFEARHHDADGLNRGRYQVMEHVNMGIMRNSEDFEDYDITQTDQDNHFYNDKDSGKHHRHRHRSKNNKKHKKHYDRNESGNSSECREEDDYEISNPSEKRHERKKRQRSSHRKESACVDEDNYILDEDRFYQQESDEYHNSLEMEREYEHGMDVGVKKEHSYKCDDIARNARKRARLTDDDMARREELFKEWSYSKEIVDGVTQLFGGPPRESERHQKKQKELVFEADRTAMHALSIRSGALVKARLLEIHYATGCHLIFLEEVKRGGYTYVELKGDPEHIKNAQKMIDDMVIDEHYIHDGRESIVYFYNAPHELRNTRGFDLNCRSIEKYCGIIIEKMREVFGIGGYVSTAPLKLTGSVNSIHMARETMQSKTKRFLDEEKFKETVEHCTPISFYRKIIGRCGENLKTIEKVTRTAIVFKRSFDNNEACFSIRGRTDNIKQAIEKIEEITHENQPADDDPGIFQVRVPENMVARLIGRHGVEINRIRSESKAKCYLNAIRGNLDDKFMVCSGGVEEAAYAAYLTKVKIGIIDPKVIQFNSDDFNNLSKVKPMEDPRLVMLKKRYAERKECK